MSSKGKQKPRQVPRKPETKSKQRESTRKDETKQEHRESPQRDEMKEEHTEPQHHEQHEHHEHEHHEHDEHEDKNHEVGEEKKNENDNYDEEYEKLKEQNSGLVALEQLRQIIEGRIELAREKTLSELYEDRSEFDSVQTEVVKAKKLLRATNKYVVDDFSLSIAALRQSLGTYSSTIHEKLKHEYKPHREEEAKSETEVESLRKANVAHEAYLRVTVELKELEQFATEIEESSHRLAAEAGEGDRDAEYTRVNVDAAGKQLSNDGEPVETEEERLMREEEKRLEAEEAERREREEKEEKERREEEAKKKKVPTATLR